MGKYLQDIVLYGPNLPLKGFSEEKKQAYGERYSQTLKALPLIETLYNYYLPAKYETGHQIWRFAIHLEETATSGIVEMGHVPDCVVIFDNDFLQTLSAFQRKASVLDLVQEGFREICRYYHCSPLYFEQIYQTIKQKDILLSEVYRKPKRSPNKHYVARLHVFQSEEEREVSVLIEDQAGQQVRKIKLSDHDFWLFDEIEWQTNDLLRVYYVNAIQSYKRRKVAEDYLEVYLSGLVTFVPVTRETVFQHALDWMTRGEEGLEEAMGFLKRAEELGHGKATNILAHLASNPQERNLTKLMQLPKKGFFPEKS